ncbi:MAG: alanine racemase [Pseudomonadota bacterium]
MSNRTPDRLESVITPALVLDRSRMHANIERMHAKMHSRGVRLRPHLKTAKSIDVAQSIAPSDESPICVSTIAEAQYFHANGYRDICYAVGLVPSKVPAVADLVRAGTNMHVLTDNVAAAHAIADAADRDQVQLNVLIELDVDGHRSGVKADDALLLELAGVLTEHTSTRLGGVLTHAGKSYECDSIDAIRDMAETERAGAVLAATRLRAAGFECPIVSIGSTPTATFAPDLSGVTEVRAGVFVFHDLVMAGLGVCALDDIALSVLVAVIGHRPDRGWLITDGGWMALSRDRGTAAQKIDYGYGLVADIRGDALQPDTVVIDANQEHGIIARRDGSALNLERYPVGTLLRVYPNHSCATAAQHDEYLVASGDDSAIQDRWPRIGGWRPVSALDQGL